MNRDERWTRLPDAGLVERVRNPVDRAEREAALNEIMRRYQRAMSTVGAYRLRELERVKDVVQDAVEAATRDLVHGNGPREPEKLRAWLCGIVENRCHEDHRRRDKESPVPWEPQAADEDEADSLRRADEVNRMFDVVATTFTRRQRKIYQLNIRSELHGKALAAALTTSTKNAYKFAYENKIRVDEGFGALILAKHGRPHCPRLAGILDGAGWDGTSDAQFTRILRQRILRHLGTCRRCDNCGTCDRQRTRLKLHYAPVFIPILIAPELTESIPEIIRRVLDEEEQRDRTDKRGGAPATGAGVALVSAAAAQKPDKSRVVDWILDGLKGIFVLILVVTIGPKLFPDVFDNLHLPNTTVRLSIFVPGGYTVYANPPGTTCRPTAGNCNLQYKPGTRVTLTAQRGGSLLYQGPLSWTGCVAGGGSGETCTLVPRGNARVCLVEPGYQGMPWAWCRG
ncbi:RNA polymerase sigma factor [Nocardia brasiliensis]